MKKLIVLFTLIYLCYSLDDCTNFDTFASTACASFTNTSFSCYFSGGKCLANYNDCNKYAPNPNTNFVDSECTKIVPPVPNYKCGVITDSGTKKCERVLKNCDEWTTSDTCTSLKADNNKRCVFIDDTKCEAHFDECSNAPVSQCSTNIPKDVEKKCVLSEGGTACEPKERTCSDFQIFIDTDFSYKPCKDLRSTSPKICFLVGSVCSEVYKNCEDASKTECDDITPFNVDFTAFDTLSHCIPNGEKCKKELKHCGDYKKEKDVESFCQTLPAEDSTNQICRLDEKGDCVPVYKTCESYNQAVTEENRVDIDCKKITPRDSNDFHIINGQNKCKYDTTNHLCKTQELECNEIKSQSDCNLSKSEKIICAWEGNECKEKFTKCEYYNEKAEAKENSECLTIAPFIDTDSFYYKCTLNDGVNCGKEKIYCKGQDEQNKNFCEALAVDVEENPELFECKLIGNKCVAQYKDCDSYNGVGTDKAICESIMLSQPNYKCILEKDKDCIKKNKLCSEYLGNSETTCNLDYVASDESLMECTFSDGKCIEVSKNRKSYLYCSDYRGTKKEECESIQPHLYNSVSIDYSSKCVYTNEGCVKKAKECKDASNENLCNLIDISDEKRCVYKGNNCVEQYKTCELYQNKEQTLSREVCESLILSDNSKICAYQDGASGTKGTCTTRTRVCEEFKIESIKAQCTSINPTDLTKKCVFENNGCTSKSKTCLELSTFSGATDEKCKSALKSSDSKVCSLKSDQSGCEEVDKPPEPVQTTQNTQTPENGSTGSNGEENHEEDNNSGSKTLSLSLISFILLILF